MRILQILGIFLCLFIFAACKDAKIVVKMKSNKSGTVNPPGMEINSEQNSAPMTFAAISMKARVEMNPVVTSPNSTLTSGGITMRAGIVR